MQTNHEVGLSLIKHGFYVFPCDPVSKEPCTPHGFKDASNDIAVIQNWWKWNNHPNAIVGIWPSKSGIAVIDCDNKDGKQGIAHFHALCAERSIDLSNAFVVSTPNNGLHYYFKTDTEFGNEYKWLADIGINVRSAKGYVIAFASTLADGREYRLAQGTLETMPVLPVALAALLRPLDVAPTPSLPISSAVRQPVTERQRAYAQTAFDGMLNEMRPLTRPGSNRNALYNERLYKMGAYVREGWIDFQVVAGGFYAVMKETGYLDLPEHRDAVDKINRSINQGIETADLPPSAPLSVADPAWGVTTRTNLLANPHPKSKWPEQIGSDAYIGIAGEFVCLVAPHTEGDANALLIAFLTVIGSMIGRGAFMQIGATRHFTNLFSVIVADTSKGRKGTIMDEAKRFAKMVDSTIERRMIGGLSSGEGLIEAVRDPREEDATGDKPRKADPGVMDKRLLVTESELGQALQAAGRDGNILSAVLRLAWDGEPLRTLARSNKNVCREPHISIFGNITLDELQRLLTSTDRTNGFGNRFLWVCARRSQELPWGGNVNEAALQELAVKTAHVLNMSSYFGRCSWQPDAASMWGREYSRLSSGGVGLAAAMRARAEAQTLRLALIYALLDSCNNIDVSHLRAALEVWRYCHDSVDYCFGSVTGDTTADRILSMLQNMVEGASLTQISNHFGRNRSKDELQRALTTLKESGKIRSEFRKTTGRTAEVWFAC